MEVFLSTAYLQKFMGLRLRYIASVCTDIITTFPSQVKVTAEEKTMLETVAKLAQTADQAPASAPDMLSKVVLISFDMLQTSGTWVNAWAELLRTPSEMEMAQKVKQVIGAPPPEGVQQHAGCWIA